LARGAGEEERLLVDTFEECGVGDEEATEGGDDGLLFGKGVGAVHSFSDHGMREFGQL